MQNKPLKLDVPLLGEQCKMLLYYAIYSAHHKYVDKYKFSNLDVVLDIMYLKIIYLFLQNNTAVRAC
jgi:hypothetical protein